MAKLNLNVNEIEELIATYKSAKTKLRFQLKRVDEALNELKASLASAGASKRGKAARAETTEQPEEKKEAAPRKAKPGRKPGRPKKRVRKVKGGYRLSDWDEFIVQQIAGKGRPMVNSELFDACRSRSAELGLELDDSQVQGKIARTLHKLSNKRKVLGKISVSGRGFAYGLSSWFFAKSGKLKKAYVKDLKIEE